LNKDLPSIKTLQTKAGGGDLESRKGSEPDPEPTLQLGKPTIYAVDVARWSAGVVVTQFGTGVFNAPVQPDSTFFAFLISLVKIVKS